MTTARRDGIVLIMLSAAGYAFLPIFTKWGYAAGLSATDVVTWRFIFAAPCIWLVVLSRPAVDAKPLPQVTLLGLGVLFAGVAVLAFFSLERIPASLFTVLAYAYPAFVALLSLFLGERLPLFGWLALGITLVGVVLTVPDLNDSFSQVDTLGILLGLLNGLTYAAYMVTINRLLRGHTALARASALTITGALIALLVFALFNGLSVPVGVVAWGSVVGIGIFSTVIPMFCVLSGMQKIGAPQAAIISTVEPVLVLALSFMLLGETMQPIQLIGSLLILSSPILLQLNHYRRIPKIETASTPH